MFASAQLTRCARRVSSLHCTLLHILLLLSVFVQPGWSAVPVRGTGIKLAFYCACGCKAFSGRRPCLVHGADTQWLVGDSTADIPLPFCFRSSAQFMRCMLKYISYHLAVKHLVILVRFSDHRTRSLPSQANINAVFNGGNPALTPSGSVKDYWCAFCRLLHNSKPIIVTLLL